MARKTDQELMWEVFMEASNSGPITTGGPLGENMALAALAAGQLLKGAEDDEEGEEGGDKLKAILTKCHSGDISADEAYKHITKMMKGSKPKEEDAENVKRDSAGHNTLNIMRQMSPHKTSSLNKPDKAKIKQREASQKGLRQDVRRKGGDMHGI